MDLILVSNSCLPKALEHQAWETASVPEMVENPLVPNPVSLMYSDGLKKTQKGINLSLCDLMLFTIMLVPTNLKYSEVPPLECIPLCP